MNNVWPKEIFHQVATTYITPEENQNTIIIYVYKYVGITDAIYYILYVRHVLIYKHIIYINENS